MSLYVPVLTQLNPYLRDAKAGSAERNGSEAFALAINDEPQILAISQQSEYLTVRPLHLLRYHLILN